jgi:hypothetical protein
VARLLIAHDPTTVWGSDYHKLSTLQAALCVSELLAKELAQSAMGNAPDAETVAEILSPLQDIMSIQDYIRFVSENDIRRDFDKI